jgi:hypothetical protein
VAIVPTSAGRDHRTWLAPVAAGAIGLAGLAYVRTVDPARDGVFPACPFHRVTGLWCPGCGMTRALHALLHGEVAAAIGSNVFLPLAVLLCGYLWLSWLWPTVRATRLPSLGRVPAAVWGVLVAAALAYGVLRNLPLAPFSALAP